MIEACNLTKHFKRIRKSPGIAGAIKSLIRPDVERLCAVDDFSIKIGAGEMVAILGPNGAGKSTTIKMLTGILTPTSGEVTINGHSPRADRKKVCAMLGVVFGQRSQLYWELRLGESYEVLRRIYKVEPKSFRETMERVSERLGLQDFLDVPVRQLSLGQRMRGEVAAALLHSPDLLLLDEPTIGIDIEAKAKIRQFIKEQNEELGTTVVLTSHDVEDVSSLCERVVIINHGKMVSDEQVDDDLSDDTLVSDFMIRLNKELPDRLIQGVPDWQISKVGDDCYRCQSTSSDPAKLVKQLEKYGLLSIASVEEEGERELKKASRLQGTLLRHYQDK